VTLKGRVRLVAVAVLASTVVAYAADKKDKPKPAGAQQVDSGSFGVFVRGQRVVTENFTVQQENGVNVVKSQLQETGSASSGQRSDLEMTGSGELLRYEWNDGGGSLVVTPKNEFLLEKITTSASSKAAEQPFLMPNTSAILDNNFFIHREVLAWRYLATNCKTEAGTQKCQKDPADFGVLVPQDRTSMRVRMELVGREKVTIRGTERELLRLNLKGEEFTWALWVDDQDQFKLMRVLIADANTEVVRD
jgi:hypothetical protein